MPAAVIEPLRCADSCTGQLSACPSVHEPYGLIPAQRFHPRATRWRRILLRIVSGRKFVSIRGICGLAETFQLLQLVTVVANLRWLFSISDRLLRLPPKSELPLRKSHYRSCITTLVGSVAHATDCLCFEASFSAHCASLILTSILGGS